MLINAHNDHYKEMLVEPFELMKAILTPEEFRGFLKGNAIKYAMRAGHKGTAEDAEADADKFLFYSSALKFEESGVSDNILGSEFV